MSVTQFKDTNIIGTLTINDIPVAAGLVDTLLIDARSGAASQEPVAVDTPLQIEFGPEQTSPDGEVTLLADGTVRFNDGGSYFITLSFRFGRLGASGVSVVLGQLFFNGSLIPNFEGFAARIDNANIIIPQSITFVVQVSDGDEITAFIARDGSGNDSGGLFEFEPTTLPWNTAPSAGIRISTLKTP